MRITEKTFQSAARYGGIVLGIAAILNLYLILRYREVYRNRAIAEMQFQRTVLQQQAFEGALQAVLQLAPKDPQVVEILRKYQIVGGAPAGTGSQTQGAKP